MRIDPFDPRIHPDVSVCKYTGAWIYYIFLVVRVVISRICKVGFEMAMAVCERLQLRVTGFVLTTLSTRLRAALSSSRSRAQHTGLIANTYVTYRWAWQDGAVIQLILSFTFTFFFSL